MEPTSKQLRVVISGRVQGVWFRGWASGVARGYGLDGWIRNRRDGTVEAVFAGPADAVDDMVRECRRGPPAARVVAVEIFGYADPVPPGFASLRSA
jgi:acylphosphatase